MHLETERLLLREFSLDDWPAFLSYQTNPLYLRYYEWESRDEASVRAFIARLEAFQHEDPRTTFQLATTLKATGEVIGNCGIRLTAFGSHDGNIGYEFDPRFWRQGLGTEAARELVRFGFEELGLQRIEAEIVADNAGSAGVLRNTGMQLEGTLRKKLFYKGRYWDRQWFAVLREEWLRET